jgi:type II secretory pathway pseudopilin PulG
MRYTSNNIRKSASAGFSLIEALVYLSITVVLAGALVTTFLSLNTTLLRNRTERELTHSASVSLERMVRDIREANSVDTGMSTLGSSPGVLELESASGTTRFYLSSGALVVNVNGTEIGPLTSDAVTVQGLVFQKYTGSTTDMVRVGLTLSAVSRAASSTRTFYTSAVLRGSYE